MVALIDRWDFRPTIPVTASVLDRHPAIVSRLNGADLAIHGYHHRSYAEMTVQEQAADLDGAISAFGRHGLVTSGFRAPYLGTRPSTFSILISRRFVYDSSIPVFCLPEQDPISSRVHLLAEKRYGRTQSSTLRVRGGRPFTELPVALPDDEILVDGLGIRRASALSRVLTTMAERARVAAGHLILQVHPERFDIMSDALDSVLQKATDDGAWRSSLSEAAEWILSSRGGRGRWPDGAPYAVSVSGDLDAVSLADFAGRTRVT